MKPPFPVSPSPSLPTNPTPGRSTACLLYVGAKKKKRQQKKKNDAIRKAAEGPAAVVLKVRALSKHFFFSFFLKIGLLAAGVIGFCRDKDADELGEGESEGFWAVEVLL